MRPPIKGEIDKQTRTPYTLTITSILTWLTKLPFSLESSPNKRTYMSTPTYNRHVGNTTTSRNVTFSAALVYMPRHVASYKLQVYHEMSRKYSQTTPETLKDN
ncbi:hypothetical protein EYC80_010581 [Monilinia laxa]|uniref:Uncharacterized protein n=1 Tax=Monilinia laxa TaxID=61186 RepID=A0A5N6JPD3_MONLA|nr:hypothetical protein EYC80_010581 [Monilinia laxa]